MATRNEIDSNIPIEVEKGGTETTAFVAYTPVCGGTGAATALQSVASIANANDILTSEGAGALPEFKTPITYFEQLASDPGSPVIGQVWYNTTTDLFKGAIGVASGVWVVKSNTIYGPGFYGGSGTPDDAFGAQAVNAQRYDGAADSWASKTGYGGANPAVETGTDAGDGLAAGGVSGGSVSNQLKRYDGVGDSWTTKANLLVSCTGPGFVGSADDALRFGGRIDPLVGNTYTSTTSRYDGTGNSWTAKATLNLTARSLILGCGTAGDALAPGGIAGSALANTQSVVERYDGTGNTWSTKTSMTSAQGNGGSGSAAASGIVYGGQTTAASNTATCQKYDGGANTWGAGPTLNNSTNANGSVADSNTSALTWTIGHSGAKTTERLSDFVTSVVTFTTT